MNPAQALRAAASSAYLAEPTPSARGAKAAREFEAQLIASVVESLEKTFAALPGDDSIPGADDYDYLGTQALSGALAEQGGFGIGKMIARYLQAHEGQG
jgi:Rod binding domain-containing protein